MPCIIAFIVLGIISIFSAAHRALAREAFDCVFRRVTFRPCNTGFQEKIKASFTSRFVVRAPWLARFINKYFEVLSWVVMIITLGSLFWAGRGLYNFVRFGSCNGLNDTGLCVLDPAGSHNQITSCGSPASSPEDLTISDVDLSLFAQTNPESSERAVFIGCVNCHYSRQVYELVYGLAQERQANFIFAHYPVKQETDHIDELLYCAWTIDQTLYWDLLQQLFLNPEEDNASRSITLAQAAQLGYSRESFADCLESPSTATLAEQLVNEVAKTNLYGTPVVFINDQVLVGPKPKRVYNQAFSAFKLF
ncbi:DsbA family protein [Microgenomates group bacterium]|nr:DsbA family protein [Microgenomates group bacterium]